MRSDARQPHRLLSRGRIRWVALAAILLAGCRNGSKPSPAPDDAIGQPLGSAPAHFSDLPPGDTTAVIAMMHQTMRGIDAGLAVMTQRDTTLASDSTSHHLTAWLQGGTVRKLVVIDSTVGRQNNVETDIWFMGGDVAVLLQAADAYAFDSDRIVLWTDESLNPRVDVTPDLMMARQATLIDQAQRWLAMLGVKSSR
jgi:hypothetical protein